MAGPRTRGSAGTGGVHAGRMPGDALFFLFKTTAAAAAGATIACSLLDGLDDDNMIASSWCAAGAGAGGVHAGRMPGCDFFVFDAAFSMSTS